MSRSRSCWRAFLGGYLALALAQRLHQEVGEEPAALVAIATAAASRKGDTSEAHPSIKTDAMFGKGVRCA